MDWQPMEFEQGQSNSIAPPSRQQLWPDARGRFGEFGGRYVPETLMHPVEELEQAYQATRSDAKFQAELAHLLKHFAGRPTPLFHARRLTEHLGAAQIYLKREDLCTRAPTRSITAWGRACSPGEWARREWWRKPARGSTAWPQPAWRHFWA